MKKLRAVQITDIHLQAEDGAELYGVDTAKTLQNIINQIKCLAPTPDLLIATGDLAEDGAIKTYNRLSILLSSLNMPIYTLPGNHDDLVNMKLCLNAGQSHYKQHAMVGNWGFVFINSQVVGESHGLVSVEELLRIEGLINSMGDRFILLALHHPPKQVCPSLGCQLHNSEELMSLLDQHENVKVVISGHTHNEVNHSDKHYQQLTTPSTFAHVTHAQWGEMREGQPVNYEDFWQCHELNGELQGFRTLDLYEDGHVETRVHWIDEHDRF